MSSSIVAGILASAEQVGNEMAEVDLPIPPIGYGIIAMAMFLVLLGITYSFKNVAARR